MSGSKWKVGDTRLIYRSEDGELVAMTSMRPNARLQEKVRIGLLAHGYHVECWHDRVRRGWKNRWRVVSPRGRSVWEGKSVEEKIRKVRASRSIRRARGE